MKKEEYAKIVELAQGADTRRLLLGDSLVAIQTLRDKLAVYYARLSYELAQAKDWIQMEYLEQIKNDQTIRTAEAMAEMKYFNMHEISRRELDYMRDAVDKLMNSCASHLKEKAV